jgi:type VI secretion system protein VasJ
MPTYREEVAERIAGMLAPLSGASGAGADISYDPDFEAVKAEIDKLSSVDNTEPSWGRIDQLGTQLLSQKGKDLRIVAWLTVARAKTASWRGFAEALLVFDTLARSFWDTMYPEARRARARLNAIAWMADMVHQTMQGQDVSLSDGDAVRMCDEVLNELDRLLAEKLGDGYVGPGQLRSMMRDKVASIPAPAPEPVAGEPVAADTGAASVHHAAAAPTGPVAPTTPDQVEGAIKEYGRLVCESATVLRIADKASAWAYKLMRLGVWLPIKGPPPASGGRTELSAPDGYARTEMEGHAASESWSDLRAAAEGHVQANPFWLDPHRFVSLAMEKLGPDFDAAREAVGREVVRFVGTMPDLTALKFSDGSPLADEKTHAWLADEAAKHGGGGGGSKAAAAISKEDEEVAARFVEAQQLASNGRVSDGLALGLALAERSPDARMRFRARLSVAKMALDAAKHDLARGMLEQMLHDVERHGLETWEPATCATLYSQLLVATREVSRAKGEPQDLVARQQQLFDKLCRLDPAAAIRLSS